MPEHDKEYTEGLTVFHFMLDILKGIWEEIKSAIENWKETLKICLFIGYVMLMGLFPDNFILVLIWFGGLVFIASYFFWRIRKQY